MPESAENKKIQIVQTSDESIEIRVVDAVTGASWSVGSANHDEDGWAGMERVESMGRAFSRVLGMPLEETDEFGDE